MANIVRFIVVKASPDKAADIERLWKKECGPLMIKRPGCLSEELLRCVEEAVAMARLAAPSVTDPGMVAETAVPSKAVWSGVTMTTLKLLAIA